MNSKTPWTPGPWRVGDAGKTVFGPPCGIPPVIVANCDYQQTRLGGSKQANARLIAAAPELVEALRQLYKLAARVGEPEHEAMKAARTLLAKLEGGKA